MGRADVVGGGGAGKGHVGSVFQLGGEGGASTGNEDDAVHGGQMCCILARASSGVG